MQFANTKTSQDHYSSSHNLKCSKCSEVFDNSDNLEVHEAEHGLKRQGSSNAGEPDSTEIQIIDFDLDFENPVNSQASLDLGFKCSDCELTFATESGLDIHQLGAHPTVRFFTPFHLALCANKLLVYYNYSCWSVYQLPSLLLYMQ